MSKELFNYRFLHTDTIKVIKEIESFYPVTQGILVCIDDKSYEVGDIEINFDTNIIDVCLIEC